jgi:hypothetical protein
MFSSPGKHDIEVTVVAYVDNGDPKALRVVRGSLTALKTDLVLLHSATRLGLKDYPTPAKLHSTPSDHSLCAGADIFLLGYNGLPSATTIKENYPNSDERVLFNAVRHLWIDRLSFAKGKRTGPCMPGAVIHRISSYAGNSGGALVNKIGEVIGSAPCLSQF